MYSLVLLLVGTVVLVGGCGGTPKGALAVAEMSREPLLQGPDGATELGRRTQKARVDAVAGDVMGYVRVVWASPLGRDELVAWYLSKHQAEYRLEEIGVGKSARGYSGIGKPNLIGSVIVDSSLDGTGRVPPDEPIERSEPPPGTRSIAIVSVLSPQ